MLNQAFAEELLGETTDLNNAGTGLIRSGLASGTTCLSILRACPSPHVRSLTGIPERACRSRKPKDELSKLSRGG